MSNQWSWEYSVEYHDGRVEDGELTPFQPMSRSEIEELVKELYELDPDDYKSVGLRLINLRRYRGFNTKPEEWG